MNHRQPPPPPHQHNTTLPPPRHLPSRGETDISYDAYSPSPSSLSAHRNKYNRIQDWAIYNTLYRPRIGGSGMIHDPSMGLGSASWSDTGTGITEDASDLGTVPTTVKDARGGSRPREKVDVRREMSENRAKQARGLQRKPSRLRDELDISELPYRQSSIRRDPIPTTTRPAANGSAPDKLISAVAPKGPGQAPAPQRPLLHHSKSTKPAPTPALAKPPTPPKDSPRMITGAIFVTSPESDTGNNHDQSKGKVMSPYAIREAYLESALTLPIDMLSQVQREKHLQTPAPTLKGAKSASSISSGVTITRLASLLGKASPGDGDKEGRKEGVRHLGSSKTLGAKPSRTPLVVGNKVDPVRQAKSNQARAPSPTATAELPRSLGSAPALGRSTTVPANTKKLQPITTQPVKPSALGLDLGLGPELRPAPHRQLSALRRPALTPGSSAENLLAAVPTLGRRSRDPSMTDLKTRFEPATYPLPESKSSVGTKRTEVTDEDLPGKGGKKGKKGAEAALANVEEVRPAEVLGEEPITEDVPAAANVTPVARRTTPPKVKRPPIAEPTPTLAMPDTLDFISPTSPDFLTPSDLTPLPLDRHTLPRGITSRVAHDDRVSFEVPNGTRGRLRVSLAWVRDRATRSHTQTLTPSDAPPPLPPKSPPTRHRFKRRVEEPREKEVRRPSPYPSASASSPRSPEAPIPAQAFHDPFFAQPARAYQPPPIAGMSGYPLGRPFPYPQPQPGAWASMPHLAPQAQMQMQGMMGTRYAPHLAQSAESFEPPSARQSPIPGMISLPNVGMGVPMGMPMGMGHIQGQGQQGYGQGQGQGQGQGRSQMGMGMGMQNGINPYSNLSLAQQHNQNQHHDPNQGWGQDHDDQQHHDQGQGYGQGQIQGRNPYQFGNLGNNGQDGNRGSIWKRMLNGNFNPGNRQNGNANGQGYRVQRNAQGQYEDHDDHMNQNHDQNQAYGGQRHRQQRGWGDNESKIGNWMRGITPGKKPPEGSMGLNLNLNNGNMAVRDRKNYNLSQPIFGRRRQYNGPINDENLEQDRGQRRNDGRGRGREGGMMNWLSTLQNPGDRKRLQGRQQRNGGAYGNDYYSTNQPRQNVYGNDPFRADDREAKRRQKAERRNDREDRARRQAQAQAQGRRGQRKWKDRLPRNRDRNRDLNRTRDPRRDVRQEVAYGQGRGGGGAGTTGLGLLGNLFR